MSVLVRRRLALKLLTVLGVVTFACIVEQSFQRHPVLAQSAAPPSPQEVRVTTFISQVAELSTLEKLWKSLDEVESDEVESDEASMILTSAAMQSSEAMPELTFSVMLADRRVSRIFEELQALPAQTAREACRRVFQEKLAALRGDWVKFGSILKEIDTPFLCPELRRRYLAVAASVFLASSFCSPRDVTSMIDAWPAAMAAADKESGFDVAVYQQNSGCPLRDVYPEELLVANIYAVVIDRHRCADLAALKKDQSVRLPELTFRPIVRWNANSRSGPNGIPATEILAKVPYFGGWYGLVPGEPRRRAVTLLRKLVDACPPENQP